MGARESWSLCSLAVLASLQIGLGFVAPNARQPLGAAVPVPVQTRAESRLGMAPLSPEELSRQKGEALQSLADFNDGAWSGRATSFSITSDSAAGVTKRKWSRPYRTSVSTRYGLGGEGLKVTETFDWTNGNGNDGDDGQGSEEGASTCVATRTVPLGKSTDIDAVDGSYSVDVALLDLPSAISGTDMLVKFAVEQTLAVSDDERVRCFLLYGMDDLLSRVVICDETRAAAAADGQGGSDVGETAYSGGAGDFASTSPGEDEQIAADVERLVDKITGGGKKADEPPESKPVGSVSPAVAGPITAETTVEERMERLQKAFADAKKKSDGGNEKDSASGTADRNERYPMDMFSLTLGVWLGDAVVRDQDILPSSSPASKGFGSSSRPLKSNKKNEFGDGFAEWVMGVQKVTMTFKYDFADTCRQVMHFGRSMGAPTGGVPISSMGTINDELMSRRLKPEERMLYIDYDMGKYAGFIVGSVYIKAPRYLSFSQSSSLTPFLTEFSVFQRKIDENSRQTATDIGESEELPEAFCSRMTRLYNKDGQLSQGSTSFFILKPMTPE